MKIYTGTGDRGKTSLFSGERVSKSSLRIAAYGELDELNSVIGAMLSAMDGELRALKDELQVIQARLLDAGAWLATTPGSGSVRFLKAFTMEPAQMLETAIDRMSEDLPELRHFILPGGHLSGALAHMARTVCRRAERHVTELAEHERSAPDADVTLKPILVFLNRLSDYLFVAARYCNRHYGREDLLWNN